MADRSASCSALVRHPASGFRRPLVLDSDEYVTERPQLNPEEFRYVVRGQPCAVVEPRAGRSRAENIDLSTQMKDPMENRILIVARMAEADRDAVAQVFAESDATALPMMMGARRRTLFSYHGLYLHLVEAD